ncbi:MAG: adenylate/guanylate cyclase domain-containing protein [Pseudomonadota bacterium]
MSGKQEGSVNQGKTEKPRKSLLHKLREFFALARLVGFVALALFIALRINDPAFVQTIRLQGFDYLQRLKPREYTKQPVAIVDLDEESFRKFGQWPWPRTLIAHLIDSLAKRGAIVTGFDVIFSERDRLSPTRIAEDNKTLPLSVKNDLRAMPDNELVMARSMQKHRVVLGQTSVRQGRDVSEDEKNIKDASFASIGPDPRQYLFRWPDLVENVPELEESAAGRGVFTVKTDPDGVFRRVPLVMLMRGKIRMTLSTELLRVATGGDSFAIKSNEAGVEGVVVGGKLVETDGNGRVWPYFTESDPSRYISASSILDGNVDPKRINGHIIIVGTSAVGLEDYRLMPLGVTVPGVEIHAQVLENILTGQMLTRPATSTLVEILLTAIAGIAIILIVPKIGAVLAFAFAVLTIASFLGYSWWSFSAKLQLVDATFPVITTGALFIIAATANYIREEQQRNQIRGAFGQYLSPALVDQLSEDPDRLVLGGETRELSVLFTDVRGFTTISESYKDYPQGLTQLMNVFLTELSQPILNRNGTIDKYMGDAIMAFWNAPLDEEDHARHACLAALEMIENVAALNAKREVELANSETETYHAINVGVGINTGPCVVGNMGSNNRFDYTALGDTVNLASRLEGQSKPYGLPIVIGFNTAELMMDELAIYEIDLIRVKGKNEPAQIYALAGDAEFAQTDDFKAFRAMNKAMISAYRTQDWTSAFEALEMMEGLGEKLGLTLEDYIFIYETRIAEFRANPPGQHWDGVYTATSK